MPIELLFIRADREQIPDEHVEAFGKMCEINGVRFKHIDIKSQDELKGCLNGNFKYICFAGHGNSLVFGDESDFEIDWAALGQILCSSNCFTFHANILLYCCEGGLFEVGCTLIESCPKLDFIIGAKHKQNSIDLLNAFNIFIYNIQIKNLTDEEAAHKAFQATEIDFEHLHRRDREKSTGEFICVKCEEFRREFAC
jgi:hypothetical protein